MLKIRILPVLPKLKSDSFSKNFIKSLKLCQQLEFTLLSKLFNHCKGFEYHFISSQKYINSIVPGRRQKSRVSIFSLTAPFTLRQLNRFLDLAVRYQMIPFYRDLKFIQGHLAINVHRLPNAMNNKQHHFLASLYMFHLKNT